jgi:hypothetical protein
MISILRRADQASAPASMRTGADTEKMGSGEAASGCGAAQETFTSCGSQEVCPEKGLKAKYHHLKCAMKEHFSSHSVVPRIIKGATLGSLGAGIIIGVMGVPGVVGLGAAGAAFGFALGAAKGCKDMVSWARAKYVDKNVNEARQKADDILSGSLKTSMKEALYGGAKGALIGAVATLGQCSPITAAVLGTAAGAGVSYFF